MEFNLFLLEDETPTAETHYSTWQSLTTGLDYWTGLLDWTTGLDYWTGLPDCCICMHISHFTYTTYNAHDKKITEQPKNWAHHVCMLTSSMCSTLLLYLIIFNLLLAVTMSVTDLTVLSSSSDTESPLKVLRSECHQYGNFQFLYLYMYVHHDCPTCF